jgi:hypothetical protein
MSTASLYSFLIRRSEVEVPPGEDRVLLLLLLLLLLFSFFFFPAIRSLFSFVAFSRFFTEGDIVSECIVELFLLTVLLLISALILFEGDDDDDDVDDNVDDDDDVDGSG